MRIRTLATFLAAGTLAATITACRATAPGSHLRPAGPPGDESQPIAHGATQGFGGLRITVRWPGRTALAIPDTARRIEISAFRSGETQPYATLEALRPQADEAGTQTLAFDRLPVGTYQLVASARDQHDRILASGTAPAVLLPGQKVSVALHLLSSSQPAIARLGVAAAAPGQRVAVFGSGFAPTAEASLSAAVGDTALPGSAIERISDGLVVLTVPAGATTGPVRLVVGAGEAASPEPLAIVARIAVTPAIATTHQPGGRVKFQVKAFDAADAEIPATGLDWRILSQECDPGNAGSCTQVILPVGPGTFDANVGRPGTDTGTATVRVGTDLVSARADIVTRKLSPADVLALGFGPLPSVPYPADNEPTADRVALGRKLFFDQALSRSASMSCATCHDPEKGFADGRPRGLANDGTDLPRNTPTTLDAAYNPVQFWDGRAKSLEQQAMGVIEGPLEFNSDKAALVAYVTGAYAADFQAAYGAEPTVELVTKAISSYERKVHVSGDSPFDRWVKGDTTALGDEVVIGMGMFLGKARCLFCHKGPTFSDGKFHNIGIPGSGTLDPGVAGITQNASDSGKFKTPTLRNIALTAPYFHDGSRATLADAVRQYEVFDADFPNLDPRLSRTSLSRELLAFLETLTSPKIEP